ncbi:MAG: hypothetical protein HRU51_09330 [Xanthomonadales bacterium]|nr:hypothetical protein [Xanthomonadales bacterium]
MKRALLLALISLSASQPAAAEEEVYRFRGSESRVSGEFEVQAPWVLDWRVTTDGVFDAAVEVSLEQAGTGVHQGRVLMTKSAGNGVRLFDQGGRFYFRIDASLANYTLVVKQLTPAEAELYTPREP